MGITYIEGHLSGATGTQDSVRFLVDSGATYSLLPKSVWEPIGLKPKREMLFSLADGTLIHRPVSECHLVLPQDDAHTPVILGDDDQVLLGVVTLDIFGLMFNQFNRTLQPMKVMLA